MRYALAVLSHGNPESPTAKRTLESFVEHVTPSPEVTVYRHDGPGVAYCRLPERGGKFYRTTPIQEGFCGATRALWEDTVAIASVCKCDYVFWLEHDFAFHRPVALAQLAEVLELHCEYAQVSLLRGAVNATEKAAGGLVESRAGEFEPCHLREHHGDDLGPVSHQWLEHRSYFTTNPSLMRTPFMALNTWPDYPSECEGRFGLDLVAAGYRYAAWGDGRPWVEHIGERTGKGY